MSLVGRTLGGRYRVLSQLGKGGMGTVYEAEQVDLARRVAIKVLSVEEADEDSLLRFKQEALAAAGLAHPNIVQVFDFVAGSANAGDEPFIVMELLRGQSLASLVKAAGKLAPARAVTLMTQVLSALAAAHDARIVHRDVKPENIFVCAAGPLEVAKVLDFGLARPLDEAKHIARTRMGIALGTPAYMAPEQARGQGADVRMDVFAAGVTLYYALSGRRPFEGKTTSELMRAVRVQPPIPLDAVCPDIDLAIVRVVERALSKEPKARFESARDFLEALHPTPGAPVPQGAPATRPEGHAQRGGKAQTAAPRRKPKIEFEIVAPAVAPGMVTVGRFAPDGGSALAVGPSGLARWTEGGWSARDLPRGVVSNAVAGLWLGTDDAVLFTAHAVFRRARGTFEAVPLPAGFTVHDAFGPDAVAGAHGGEGALCIAGNVHPIGRGIVMRGITRIAGGAVAACGDRGTLCVVEGGRVHAHVVGRASFRAMAAVGEGFVAVGDRGAFVTVRNLAAFATSGESSFCEDDLFIVQARGEHVCCAGSAAHVGRVGGAMRTWIPGSTIRAVWMGDDRARLLLDSAAVVDLPL